MKMDNPYSNKGPVNIHGNKGPENWIFLGQNKRLSSISISKSQNPIQDKASNARLIHAEGQNAAIHNKISYFLNYLAITVKTNFPNSENRWLRYGYPSPVFP